MWEKTNNVYVKLGKISNEKHLVHNNWTSYVVIICIAISYVIQLALCIFFCLYRYVQLYKYLDSPKWLGQSNMTSAH